MKICVTMVGVCRPTFERVKQNIESNMSYFLNTYKNHEFTFIVLSYINQYHEELSKFCTDKSIEAHFIPHLEESKFIYKPMNANAYRMFYSMNYILDRVPNNIYDCIIRLRLDIEVKQFELYDTINPLKYYTINENGRCGDNIGYASYKVMKQVWHINNYMIRAVNPEEALYKTIMKYKYTIKHFKFHYILYQSDDIMYDGFKQHSRRSREWIYDGIKYESKDI
jgi:hypothetical protein